MATVSLDLACILLAHLASGDQASRVYMLCSPHPPMLCMHATPFFFDCRCLRTWLQSCLLVERFSFSACRSELHFTL